MVDLLLAEYSLVNTTIPLYCRLVDFNSTGVLVYSAQLPRLPSCGFEMDVELIGCQIIPEPLVRKGTLFMHQLTSLNEDPQVERTVSVHRSNQLRGQAGVRARSGVQACPARASRMACMGGTALSLMVIR